MKRINVLLTLLVAAFVSLHAADIYTYQANFTASIEKFKASIKDKDAFDTTIADLDSLQKGLAAEAGIPKKEPLLSEIQSVYAFLGEVSPGPKSYAVTNTQKANALTLLGLTEESYNDSSLCLPVSKVKVADNYICYLVTNKSDSMMVLYKFNFLIQKKYSSSSGFVDAGVSKNCVRSILEIFSEANVKFTQEKCNTESQVIKYIQPEIIQPKVEVYPEPDYLSPQQKQAMKKKDKEKLKKEKEKQKKLAQKEKDKKKKDLEKLKKEKQKEVLLAKEAKIKQMQEQKEAAMKAAADKKKK